MKKKVLFLLIVLSTIFSVALKGNNKKITKYLLLNNTIIEQVDNADLVVGTVKKSPDNPLFIEDKLWEQRYDNFYGNVIYDKEDKIYKCWYSPFISDNSAKGMSLEERKKDYDAPDKREMAVCYATSKDGIHWEKPNLGIVEYEGTKNNNIIWRGEEQDGDHWAGPHGAGIFKDNQETNPNRKYKSLFKVEDLSVGFSKDGLHWDEFQSCEGGVTVAGDTHNNAFWAPTLNKYVGITRTWGEMGREVARIESDDFINWTKEEVVLEGLDKNLQPYAMPVFYYGGVYLGLVAIHNQKIDRVHTELTWSFDTKKWYRISPGTPLIPCSEKKMDYDYGCVYTCAYPIFENNEIKLYYGGSDWLHFGWRSGAFCLATLRPDGFAGYEAKTNSAKIVTKNISYNGGNVSINVDVNKGGYLNVFILDKNGKELAKAKSVSKTLINGKLKFDKKIEHGDIKIVFEFANAKVYSFGFSN